MNLCIFSGRLTRDAQTRYTQTQTPVTNFAIAVDTGWGDKKRTEFIDCVLWKREGMAQHLTKGKAVTLYGEYGTREWQDKDGVTRKSIEITVRDIEFQQGQPANAQPAPQPAQPQPGPAFPSEAGDMGDVPF